MQLIAPLVHLTTISLRLPAQATFSGWTSAWLHGFDVQPCNPVEVTLPRLARTSRLSGVSVVRSDVAGDEVVIVQDLPATSVVRTVADLARRLPFTDAVVVLDMALHRRMTSVESLQRWVDHHPGYRGVRRLRRALGLADGAAESPMETRLRLLLISSGLPRPALQVSLHDRSGLFLARTDLYYERKRLAIEYDGGTHRTTFAADNRRQNRLLEAGYKLLRFSATDIFRTPAAVVGQVERALGYSIGSPN